MGNGLFGNNSGIGNFENIFPKPACSLASLYDEQTGMNEGQLEFLKSNQQEIGLKLLRFARWLAADKYGWDGQSKTLPAGKDPDDIVIHVVDDYLHDIKHFNPKHGIEIQLRRAIQSELWALHQRKEAHAIPLDAEEEDGPNTKWYAADEQLPDEAAMTTHDWKILFELFRAQPEVKGDDELELLLMAIEDGAEKAPEMASQTGLSVERIYELVKKLRKIHPKLMKQFHKGMEVLP